MITGFLEPTPYTGFVNFVLEGNIEPNIPVILTIPPPKMFLSAGAINTAPLKRFGF